MAIGEIWSSVSATDAALEGAELSFAVNTAVEWGGIDLCECERGCVRFLLAYRVPALCCGSVVLL